MSVNLPKSFANLNEKLAKQFDESGVRRSFTVPYIDGQPTDEHINTVGQAAAQSGGLTGNLLTTAHHSGGKGWGSGDGHTIGHPADALRSTIIPKDDEHAKATIQAAQKHLDNLEELLGSKDPTIQTAKSQLSLVKKTDGAGMNLLDFGVMMTQIMFRPNQAVARAHAKTKPGGINPRLSAPGGSQSDNAGESQPGGEQPPQNGDQPQESAQQPPQAAGAAPDASAAPAAAPAAPQA